MTRLWPARGALDRKGTVRLLPSTTSDGEKSEDENENEKRRPYTSGPRQIYLIIVSNISV